MFTPHKEKLRLWMVIDGDIVENSDGHSDSSSNSSGNKQIVHHGGYLPSYSFYN